MCQSEHTRELVAAPAQPQTRTQQAALSLNRTEVSTGWALERAARPPPVPPCVILRKAAGDASIRSGQSAAGGDTRTE